MGYARPPRAVGKGRAAMVSAAIWAPLAGLNGSTISICPMNSAPGLSATATLGNGENIKVQ